MGFSFENKENQSINLDNEFSPSRIDMPTRDRSGDTANIRGRGARKDVSNLLDYDSSLESPKGPVNPHFSEVIGSSSGP